MASSRRRARWPVVALALLAGTAMLVGVWAQFFPRGFYTSFPSVGGQWVATTRVGNHDRAPRIEDALVLAARTIG
jgi:hypothetical protein